MAKEYLDHTGLSYLWSKIKSYFVKGNIKAFTGTCNTAAATSAKVVTCTDFKSTDLVRGTLISVYFSNTNSANTSELTLNVNSTGAKNIKFINNGSLANLQHHLKATYTYQFMYDGTYWIVFGFNYDTNTYDRLYTNGAMKAKTAITANALIAGTSEGYSNLSSGEPFDINYQILFASSAVNAGATATNFYTNCRVTISYTQSLTLVAYKAIYVKGYLSGTMFTPASTAPLTQDVPTSPDGYYYIFLGIAYSTAGMILMLEHPVYRFVNGLFQEVNGGDVIADSGGTLAPIYVGDYICQTWTWLPSAVYVKPGTGTLDGTTYNTNFFFCFDAPQRKYATDNKTNIGRIQVFDQHLNQKVGEISNVTISHANSIACDGTHLYVAPLWEVNSSGTEVDAKFLYVFNAPTVSVTAASNASGSRWNISSSSVSMTSVGKITTPTQAMGVSYDHVTGKLYYLDYSRNVYVLTKASNVLSSTWTLYTNINLNGVKASNDFYGKGYYYNQDFAVYDNHFYISSPENNIAYGNLVPGTSYVRGVYTSLQTDSTNRFYLGENEGMEFTPDGHLYMINILTLTSYGNGVRQAYVMELPVGITGANIMNIRGNVTSYGEGALELSEYSQSMFALSTSEIRSLQQLQALQQGHQYTIVTIPKDNRIYDEKDYQVVINRDIRIDLYGEYHCSALFIRGGHTSIQVWDNTDTSRSDGVTVKNGTISFHRTSGPSIELNQSGSLTLGGGDTVSLRVERPNYDGTSNFIQVGSSWNRTYVRRNPTISSGTLKIGGVDIKIGRWVGAYWYPVNEDRPVVIETGQIMSGTSTTAKSYKDISVTFAKTFTTAPIVVVGFQFDSTAYTFGWCSCSVLNVTTTGFTIRIFNGDSSNRAPALNWIASGS